MSYSSFFESGLMAAYRSPPPSPAISVPDSPIIPSTPKRDISDIEEDTTPTGLFQIPHNAERSKLRKRRSSLTVATSPLAQIKSSVRNANNAVQRQNALVYSLGNRSRSGSVTDTFSYGQTRSSGFATENNSLMGRLRSGSVGTLLRSRRVLRKPAPPPPSAPLPPLPLPVPAESDFDICSPPNTPRRRPLTFRSSTMDNYDQAMPSSPISAPHFLNVPFSNLRTKTPARDLDDDDDKMKEN